MAKVGDTVRYLNSVGGGRIVRIDGNTAYVDEDGFETPVLQRECVVVASLTSQYNPAPKPKANEQPQQKAAPAPAPQPEPEIVVEETPEGEKLNIVLGFEATDIKRLSTADFDAYLVNDSNYYLYYSWLTRPDDSQQWTMRSAGLIEPGITVYLATVERDELNEIARTAVQIIAFKRDKPFDAKAPVWVEHRFDGTKFCKLHCFTSNPYFDVPVIAFNIVEEDVPARAVEIDEKSMQQSMQSKIRDDRRQPRKAEKKKTRPDEPIVVDLHITELLDNTNGMSNADMLNVQIDAFRKVMDANLHNHGKKIVFIHGKGEGVLRHALLKELNHRYKGNDVQDASFREYGFGATQVRIR